MGNMDILIILMLKLIKTIVQEFCHEPVGIKGKRTKKML
jgi:hypothetical protein